MSEPANGGSSRPAATRALDRGLALLTLLAENPQGMSAPMLAETAELSRATAYRLLQTLEQRSYVTLDENSRRYRLGPVFDRWLMGPDSQMALSSVAGPVMRALSERTGESIGLHVRSGWERIVINKVEPDAQPLRYVIDVTAPRKLATGASGAVLLSQDSPENVRAAVEHSGLEDPEAAMKKLLARIEEIRARGFAHAHEETVQGLASMSAPVYASNGRVSAALALSGPTSRFTDERREIESEHLVSGAREITEAIGAGR